MFDLSKLEVEELIQPTLTKTHIRLFARHVVKSVQAFMQDPKNQEEFQKWLKAKSERRAKDARKTTKNSP